MPETDSPVRTTKEDTKATEIVDTTEADPVTTEGASVNKTRLLELIPERDYDAQEAETIEDADQEEISSNLRQSAAFNAKQLDDSDSEKASYSMETGILEPLENPRKGVHWIPLTMFVALMVVLVVSAVSFVYRESCYRLIKTKRERTKMRRIHERTPLLSVEERPTDGGDDHVMVF